MSRLLTLLMLYKAGYIAGKYVSIEKMIEQTKDSYYESLRLSSEIGMKIAMIMNPLFNICSVLCWQHIEISRIE